MMFTMGNFEFQMNHEALKAHNVRLAEDRLASVKRDGLQKYLLIFGRAERR